MTETPTRYARSGEVNIAYQVHGDGPVDVVFVPGFVSHVELAAEHPAVSHFFRRLASFSRLITFDKRGQGLSDRIGRPPTLEESMDDVIAVMDATGCESASLFGISEGGPMSILAAATHPDRVRSLALYGTYARMLRTADYPEGISERAYDRFERTVAREWGGPLMTEIWAPSEAGKPEFEEWWARLLRQGTSPRGALELISLHRELDVRPALDAVGCPTLVLHRADDHLTPARMGRYLADHIPGARYVELDGDDHLAFAGDADGMLDELEEFLVGSRRARDPDRALATVLFTDIVDSTATGARLGDTRWRELLERHDAVVRHELRLHRGTELKALGDGFLATFDGPARAIRCARAIRDRLAKIGIEVRAGIHAGEVELIGDDIGGIAVNIGARVGALARSGEILVSSTVKELVVGSGLEFEDRGSQALKGVPGSWRLFALGAASPSPPAPATRQRPWRRAVCRPRDFPRIDSRAKRRRVDPPRSGLGHASDRGGKNGVCTAGAAHGRTRRPPRDRWAGRRDRSPNGENRHRPRHATGVTLSPPRRKARVVLG